MQKLVVASNRLPVTLHECEDGSWAAEPSSGGLVQAICPILARSGGTWVGWPGIAGDRDNLDASIGQLSATSTFDLQPVCLPDGDIEGVLSALFSDRPIPGASPFNLFRGNF